jgi:hypothetical protein
MVGADGKPSDNGKGRLEYYDDNKWGSLCNKAFGNLEADVACR